MYLYTTKYSTDNIKLTNFEIAKITILYVIKIPYSVVF